MDGPLYCGRGSYHYLVSQITPQSVEVFLQVLETHLDFATSDKMGRVSIGWMRVSAPLKPISAILLAREKTRVDCHDVLGGEVKIGEGHLPDGKVNHLVRFVCAPGDSGK